MKQFFKNNLRWLVIDFWDGLFLVTEEERGGRIIKRHGVEVKSFLLSVIITGIIGGGIGILLLIIVFFTTGVLYDIKTFLYQQKKSITKTYRNRHQIAFRSKSRVEEILGDLDEIKTCMQEVGTSKTKIWLTLTFHKVTIVFYLYKNKITTWLSEQFKISK